jgi:hypothetical protein
LLRAHLNREATTPFFYFKFYSLNAPAPLFSSSFFFFTSMTRRISEGNYSTELHTAVAKKVYHFIRTNNYRLNRIELNWTYATLWLIVVFFLTSFLTLLCFALLWSYYSTVYQAWIDSIRFDSIRFDSFTYIRYIYIYIYTVNVRRYATTGKSCWRFLFVFCWS